MNSENKEKVHAADSAGADADALFLKQLFGFTFYSPTQKDFKK